MNTGPGTTPNIKQIVIGRCYEYITLVNPSYRWVVAYVDPLSEENVYVRLKNLKIFETTSKMHSLKCCLCWPISPTVFVCVYRYKCEEIWHEFEKAVVQRAPCSVRVKDYERMFHAASQSPPCDKVRISIRNIKSCVKNCYACFCNSWWSLTHNLITWPRVTLLWLFTVTWLLMKLISLKTTPLE